jgi:CDP-glucose 4,6-dehydratase
MVDRRSTLEELVVMREFWNSKRVLVTGHTGFKGSWLSLWLQELGATVSGYSLDPPTEPNLFKTARVGERMQSIKGDLRDLAELRNAVAQARPEVVFHLAAQPLVRQSYAEPVETFATNVMGTVNLLEALRDAPGLRAIVVVTTDKCYENREQQQGYKETDRLGGRDPYSNSKACVELVAQSYRDSFFDPACYAEHRVGLATGRAGNVIGGGDWARDRLLPDALRAVNSNQALTIRNPHAIRPWQHVLDAVSGYLLLAQQLWIDGPHYAQAWNFGPMDDDVREVAWVIEEFRKQSGLPLRWEIDPGPKLHEAQLLKLDCLKAHEQLHWHPRWDVSTALRQTALWHQAHAAGHDMRAATLAQIHEYTHTLIS